MTLDETRTAIRHGAFAGFFVAGATGILATIALWMQPENDSLLSYYRDPLHWLDAVFTAVLALGVWFRSRVAAVTLVVYFVVGLLTSAMREGPHQSLLLALMFVFFFVRAAYGTFVYHRLRKEEDPEYKPVKNWIVWWLFPLGSLAFALLAITLMIGILGPSSSVVAGNELRSGDEKHLRETGILQEGETVELFYSGGLFSIAEMGSILTDRRVIAYEAPDKELVVGFAKFEEIVEVKKEREGSLVDDATLLVTRRDGVVIRVSISTENKGDERFLARLQERIAEHRK